ncbi:MAG TPA: 4'-phosphopantetheinyl transferase superfamily protein [Anaerolineae bacterium]|nr:4'-phosphopantetheinyl transferase superfamily protein [Anaerolineae bacterium]
MSTELAWRKQSAEPVLEEHDIHVWRIALDQPEATIHRLQSTLSSDERERAERFQFDRDRRRFISAHAALRMLLARYLASQPNQIRFEYGAHGKPWLAANGVSDRIEFNLAHSGEYAVCGITRYQPIGIDLEFMRPVLDADQIVERFFSTQECATFRALPTDLKHATFFAGWTRKEAFIKAIGDGLSRPLDQFDVALAPGDPARIMSVGGSEREARNWSLFAFAPETNYVGAVAVASSEWSISYWTWEFSNGA